MDSILTSVKKLLGLTEEYTAFDADLIMHINSVLIDPAADGRWAAEGFGITSDGDMERVLPGKRGH